jgi:hypothetical protein
MKSDFYPSSGQMRRQLRNHTLIAPITWHQERRFKDLVVDPSGHDDLIGAVQRFRGKAYLEDGALHPNQLTSDGRFCQSMDYNSWHLVVQDDLGEIVSCARYYPISDPRFESTAASKSALAKSPEWRAKVKRAVEASIRQAAERGATFAELGGWCVANGSRNSAQALRTVLLMFALGEILGGTVGLSTATKRHSSSSILQRLGAQNAGVNGEELPSYYEPMFDCEMELLQFDSLRPAERYAPRVAEYAALMKSEIRVLCREAAPSSCNSSLSALLSALAPAVHSEARLFAREA